MKIFNILLLVMMGAVFAPVVANAQQTHDHSTHTAGANTRAEETSVETPDYIKGDIIYGHVSAPVEIIEYASMTCSHCKAFMDEITTSLKEKLIPEGKVRLIFRNFVRDQLDLAVSVASRCTSNVETSKQLIELYFDKQAAWATAHDPKGAIYAIADLKGVQAKTLDKCLQSREIFEHVVSIAKDGDAKFQIKSTPTVIMNGTKVVFNNYDDLKAQIQAAVAAQ